MRYLNLFSRTVPVLLAVTFVCLPELAFADDITELSERLQGHIFSLKNLAMAFMFLVGIIIFGTGIFLVYKDSKQPNQGHAKNGMIGILVGCLLLSVSAVVGVMGSTIFDDDQAQENIEAESGF